jgi:hypothetical protein
MRSNSLLQEGLEHRVRAGAEQLPNDITLWPVFKIFKHEGVDKNVKITTE